MIEGQGVGESERERERRREGESKKGNGTFKSAGQYYIAVWRGATGHVNDGPFRCPASH